MNIKDRLIVALDFSTEEEAKAMVLSLKDSITFYKVGLELFLNSGGKILEFLESQNKQIFLDLKFHDIPNTTKAACKFAASLKSVKMFNIHASGGAAMIAESSSVKREDQILLAVTALTSLDENDIQQTFHSTLNVEEFTLNLAKESQANGASGVVCSALDAQTIKNHCGQDFITVCPGIRMDSMHTGDQKRVLNPKEALQNGADYIVIGRPITGAGDPIIAATTILKMMEDA